MQRNASNNVPITEYLKSIAARDIQGRYIRPQSDVQTRLAEEIQRRTGCGHARLSAEATELQKLPVSAEPEKFVGETLTAIETICSALKRERATKFEVRFANLGEDPQHWGDQILVAVRYLA